MKTLQRKTLSLRAFFQFLLIIPLLSACSTRNTWHILPVSKDNVRTIHIVNHGWHAGIVLKASDLGLPLNFVKSYLGESKFYEIGWGDRGFYQAENINVLLVIKAIFWPSDSVMHLVSFNTAPDRYFSRSDVIELQISSNGLHKLQEFIAETFSRDDSQRVIKTASGIYGNSLFFESNASYHLAHTCNTWVAEAIEKTGAPVNSFLTLRSKAVMSQIKGAKQTYSCCSP